MPILSISEISTLLRSAARVENKSLALEFLSHAIYANERSKNAMLSNDRQYGQPRTLFVPSGPAKSLNHLSTEGVRCVDGTDGWIDRQ